MNNCKNCRYKDDPPHKYRCRTCMTRTKFERRVSANPSPKCEHCKNLVECFNKEDSTMKDECMVFKNWESDVVEEVKE